MDVLFQCWVKTAVAYLWENAIQLKNWWLLTPKSSYGSIFSYFLNKSLNLNFDELLSKLVMMGLQKNILNVKNGRSIVREVF